MPKSGLRSICTHRRRRKGRVNIDKCILFLRDSAIYSLLSCRANQEVRIRIFVGRMRTSMRNARLANYPFVPDDVRALSMILMNPQYQVITMTEDGNDNFYAGSVTDAEGGHHVLFISQRMLQTARNMRVLHGDGTFKTTPAGLNIEQVWNIFYALFHKLKSILFYLRNKV